MNLASVGYVKNKIGMIATFITYPHESFLGISTHFIVYFYIFFLNFSFDELIVKSM